MTTALKTPTVLKDAIHSAAAGMGATFKTIGSLNGRRDAPMPERNTVLHFGAELLNREFAVYAEPSFSSLEGEEKEDSSRSGRVDLFATDGRVSCVVEVKAFGKRRFDRVLEDVQRIIAYRPEADDRIDESEPTRFWSNSDERWGIVLIQSFTSDELNESWCCQVNDPQGFSTALKESVKDIPETQKDGFRELAELLRSQQAEVGKVPVCNADRDIWDCRPLYLLWAAIPLSQ